MAMAMWMKRLLILGIGIFGVLGLSEAGEVEGTTEVIVTRYYNARVLRDHEIQPGELWVSSGKIIAPQSKSDQSIDLNGSLIAPGFIDLQLNGGFGKDFSSQPGVVEEVAKQLPKYGVTAFLATVISSSPEQYRNILPTLQPRSGGRHGSEVLGVHLEGPFISLKKLGMHPRQYIASDEESPKKTLEAVYGSLEGVRMVTLAPEISGGNELVKELVGQGIVVAAGHSVASLSQLKQSVDAGLTMVSHLFNAMGTFHHREVGIIGGALTDDRLYFSLIVDEVHLSDETVKMAQKLGGSRLVLITDGMAAMGVMPGRYTFGTREIDVNTKAAYLVGSDVLAGGIGTMDAAVRKLYQVTHCSKVQALEAASLRPAKILDIDHRKGSLHIGADADFVILDDDLHVEQCYVAGEKLFSR